ncbi:MAG TPA: DUF2232 domain-containing protein [Rectinemataceae bacterium]|nr:DUF2232 domain-containing protein [Rectinemataceae bacterium]
MLPPNAASRRLTLVGPFAAGAISAVLYLSLALTFTFLIPLQMAFGRYGRRRGMVAMGVSAVLIAGAQLGRLYMAGPATIMDIAAIVVPPFVLIAALGALNAAFWEGKASPYRIFVVSSIVAAIAAPALVSLGHDRGIMKYFEERVAAFTAPLKAPSADSGYDASALAASLDPRAIAHAALNLLASCYASLILAMLAVSRWLGNRFSGQDSAGRSEARPLAEYRLPYAMLWPFLAAWAFVAGAILLHASPTLLAVAWNLALLLSMGYAAQGLGIASFIFTRWKMPRTLRFLIAATVLVSLVTPTIGVVVAILIPVLGVTEVWIPYRNPKGVGA